MDYAGVVTLEILYMIAFLVLTSAGLAIVFGMMRVINLAHGEFVMLGGYTTIACSRAGIDIYVAMLVISPIVVGLVGLIVERCIIRFLYGRMIDTMLATWGLSLLLIGLVTLIFGNSAVSVPAPIPGYQLGDYQMGGYNLFIILVTVALVVAMWGVLKFTRAGLIARGAMQGPDVVASLGYNPRKVYMITFTVGAALSGLAGGVLAPLTGLLPSAGAAYIAKAFITVITGGAAVISGTLSSAVIFGAINQVVSFAVHPVLGEIAMLALAIVLLRLMPKGITGRFFPGRHMTAWQSVGRMHWGWFLLCSAVLLLLPLVTDTHTPTLLLVWALFALSLGMMWGYAGLLSFGHAAYFGLGAYTYAIAVVNIGESTIPLLLSMLVPAVVAAIIGAMMFYGRISDVYMGVITLVVTLILFKFMSATAGDAYVIGAARLGGFNGIPGFQTLNVPGYPEISLFGLPTYYICAAALLLCYLICRWMLARSFGRVLIGIRENEARCELMGYNVPACKTAIFTICAAMAGLAGCLFANWAEIVTPRVFSLGQAAEVLIWVIVGGLGTLIGPILGAMALGYVKILLGEQTVIDNSLILGALLIIVVLGIPRGVVPAVIALWNSRSRLARRRKGGESGMRRRLGAPAEERA